MEYPKTLSPQTTFWRDYQAVFSEITFVVVVMVWGITFIFSKDALQVIGPFAYNTVRLLLGAITLAVLAGRDWQAMSRSYLWPSLITGTVLFGSYAVQAYGMQFTTASKAGFLTGTNLVYVPILSAWLLRRAPSRTAIAGVILAFVGLYLISFESSLNGLTIAPGDFWVALGGVGWALYIIVLARYSPYLNVMTYAALHVLVAALMTGICWLLFEPLVVPVTSTVVWIGVLTTGFLIIGLGTSVQTWVTRTASPTRVALIAALEPVFAAIGGWWIGELITPRIIFGGALIMGGMLLAELGHLLRQKGLWGASQIYSKNVKR
ncbi:MAG: DMT family transporter [Anaerolineae bacterium]|nr:DMT family transporter [Anaerolineae bacterium]